jgi:hypothetical protein
VGVRLAPKRPCADFGAHEHGSGGFDGHLDEDGEPDAAGDDGLLAAVDGGFGLQEVLAGFDEEGVRSPVDEALGLQGEGLLEVVVGVVPEAGRVELVAHSCQSRLTEGSRCTHNVRTQRERTHGNEKKSAHRSTRN